MISVEEALELVLSNKKDFGTETINLLHSIGRILAQPVLADRDFPAFDRVTMDGIAISYNTFAQGQKSYTIEGIQPAGVKQTMLHNKAHCIEVMTGSVLPVNADVVIPYEQCEITNGIASLTTDKITCFQNIHNQGSDAKAGDVLIEKFEKITPAIAGILASVGLSDVEVLRLPALAICSTGEELVDIEQIPESHQVRKSNIYALATALISEGIQVTIDHLPDEPAQMKGQIKQLIATHDAILFSGAVSKGKFDYLPGVLSDLDMKLIFHKVAQKPGKPFLFGKFDNGPIVFGFPGNPVSTFACFYIFFYAWLKASLHQKSATGSAILDKDIRFTANLDYHVLVKTTFKNGVLYASPVSGTNSGDLVSIGKADGLITLPRNKELFKAGEVFRFIPFCRNGL